MTLPLVLLAIPSALIGFFTIDPMLFGNWFGKAIVVDVAHHPSLTLMGEEFHGAVAMALHGLTQLPFFFALAGVVLAWFFYLKAPHIPAMLRQKLAPIYTLLDNKYYFDRFNEMVF